MNLCVFSFYMFICVWFRFRFPLLGSDIFGLILICRIPISSLLSLSSCLFFVRLIFVVVEGRLFFVFRKIFLRQKFFNRGDERGS